MTNDDRYNLLSSMLKEYLTTIITTIEKGITNIEGTSDIKKWKGEITYKRDGDITRIYWNNIIIAKVSSFNDFNRITINVELVSSKTIGV